MPAKLFHPDLEEPFVLSRSRIDNFLECRRCFYLTNRVGIARPPSFPFNLNNAVDELLKMNLISIEKKVSLIRLWKKII